VYPLFDCDASHRYMDTFYTNSLGFKRPLCRHMRVCVAAEEKAEQGRWQVWLNASVQGVTGNDVNISGLNTIFDSGGTYDQIVGED